MPAHEGGKQQHGAVGYRIFRLDERGRVQAAAVVIEAADDEAAIRHTEDLVAGDQAELWQGSRLVLRIGKKLNGQFAQQDMSSLLAVA